MKRYSVLNRRAFLTGLGAGAIAMPFARLLKASAQTAPAIKRLVVFFTPHGVVESNFWPSTTTTDLSSLTFATDSTLKPLEAFKSKMLVLRGVDNKPALFLAGDPTYKDASGQNCTRGHAGSQSLLTGVRASDEITKADKFDTGPQCELAKIFGKSIDQVIAEHQGRLTYEFGVSYNYGANGAELLNYGAGGGALIPQNHPNTAFSDIFAGTVGGIAPPAEVSAKHETILNYVKDDLNALHSALGVADRQRLEAHLESIRSLEMKLNPAPASPLEACASPSINFSGNEEEDFKYPLVGDLQMKTMAMTLACDLRRVLTIRWGGNSFHWMKDYSPSSDYGLDIPVSSTVASTLASYKDHHFLSHSSTSDANAQSALATIKRWYARQLARLLTELDAIPEGEGTMLDNTLVLWCTEIRRGMHQNDSTPFVLLGNVGGYFNTGRSVVYAVSNNNGNNGEGNGVPHNNLLASICEAFDVPLPTVDGHPNFGDVRFCTGLLSNLR